MVRPFIISQEAWLSYGADYLGVPRTHLSDEQIRSLLAFYHGAYLPTAAVVERRMELDLQATYSRFGYEPNVPTISTASLVVTVANPPAASPLALPAGFLGEQDGVAFMAETALTIPVGRRESTPTPVKALVLGSAGTLTNGAARISTAVGWLRGASIQLVDAVPGRDGDDLATVQREFAAYASNPSALVQAEDHSYWVERNFPNTIARAVGIARANVSFVRPEYAATVPAPGHLTVALWTPTGDKPSQDVLDEVTAGLLDITIPYGSNKLHVVPGALVSATGAIQVTKVASADDDVVKASVLSALDTYLDWRTWDKRNRAVRAGDIWAVVRSAAAVAHVNSVTLTNSLDEMGDPSTWVMALQPWELPVSGFYEPDITIVGAV